LFVCYSGCPVVLFADKIGNDKIHAAAAYQLNKGSDRGSGMVVVLVLVVVVVHGYK
jgi:hypothetical protein